MKLTRSNDRQWADEIDLTGTEPSTEPGTKPGAATEPGAATDPPGSRPIPLNWCLAAVAVAVIAALAGGLLYAHRTRTIVTTKLVSSPGQAAEDLTGCPVGASCGWSELPDGGTLFAAARRYLPAAQLVRAESVFDTDSAREYLVRLVTLTPDGILLTLTVTWNPAGRAVPGWRSPVPEVGPADIALVVPGRRAGTALAVAATVPAGVAVPAAGLASLAADQRLQLPAL